MYYGKRVNYIGRTVMGQDPALIMGQYSIDVNIYGRVSLPRPSQNSEQYRT